MTSYFAQALRMVRVEKDMTAKQVAEKAGVTAAYVRLIEQGKRSPSQDTAVKIMEALDAGIPWREGKTDVLWRGRIYKFQRQTKPNTRVTTILSWH